MELIKYIVINSNIIMDAEGYLKKLGIHDFIVYSQNGTKSKFKVSDLMIEFRKSKINFPSDDLVKKHIQSLPYYGTCTHEYKEGFEDGVKWVKQKYFSCL